MNAVGLLFKQVGQHTNFAHSFDQSGASNKSTNFQTLLTEKLNFIETKVPNESLVAYEQDKFPSSMLDLFSSFLDLDAEELEYVISDATSKGEAIKNIISLINSHLSKEEIEAIELEMNELIQANSESLNNVVDEFSFEKLMGFYLSNDFNQIAINPWLINVEDSSVQVNQLDPQQIYNQFQNIFVEAERILANLKNAEDVMKASPHILKLLEEWTALERKHGLLDEKVTTKEQKAWQQLIKAFQNRNQFITKQQYNRSAQVSSSDVAKWMTSLVGVGEDSEVEFIRQQSLSTSNMPLTKLEQYVIHVNQTQSSQPVDQQLIERFQSILTKNNFSARNGGINQLSIALKPDNLGEMVVRLAQINGEMTVKIIVTSTATKRMLESNIHQLKNMFSPQQVIIEKQDIDMLKLQEEQEEQSFEQQSEEEQEQKHKEKQQSDDGKFTAQFEQLLNEKV